MANAGKLTLILLFILAAGPAQGTPSAHSFVVPWPANSAPYKDWQRFQSRVGKTKLGSFKPVAPGSSSNILGQVRSGFSPFGEWNLGDSSVPALTFTKLATPGCNFENMNALWKTQRKKVHKILDQQGVVLLYGAAWEPTWLFSQSPLIKPQDINSQKIRTNTHNIKSFLKSLGMHVELADLDGLHGKFRSKQFNGQTTTAHTLRHTRLNQHVLYMTELGLRCEITVGGVNKRFFANLSKKDQKTILSLGKRHERTLMIRRQRALISDITWLQNDGLIVQSTVPDWLAAEALQAANGQWENWIKSQTSADSEFGKQIHRGYQRVFPGLKSNATISH